MLKAVLINDTSVENHFGCKFVVEQIYKKCLINNIEIIHSVKVNENWKDKIHLNRIMQSDLIIVNGEGSLHSSKTKAKLIASCAPYCKKEGKICCLINTVYQNNDKTIADDVRQFDLIFVRESESQIELKNEGIFAEVVPDLIFANQDLFDNGKEVKGEKIVFSDSVIDNVTIELYSAHKKNVDSKFLTLHTEIKRFDITKSNESNFRKVKNLVKKILGFVKNKKFADPEQGRFFSRKDKQHVAVFNQINMLFFERQDFLDAIKSAKLIVTGRFHLVCLSMLAGVPFFAIPSNTHKIQSLLKDVGLMNKIVSAEQDDFMSLDYQEWTENDNLKVKEFINHANKEIDLMFEKIRSLN